MIEAESHGSTLQQFEVWALCLVRVSIEYLPPIGRTSDSGVAWEGFEEGSAAYSSVLTSTYKASTKLLRLPAATYLWSSRASLEIVFQ
jgi:hypothetical protein